MADWDRCEEGPQYREIESPFPNDIISQDKEDWILEVRKTKAKKKPSYSKI